ncbi:hypothetical protein D3C86_1377790 [compost metagenome]
MARLATGNRNLPLAFSANHAVGGNCKLQNHMRAFFHLACEVTGKRAPALGAQQSGFHHDTGVAQYRITTAGNPLIRIIHRHHDTGDAVFHQRIGAGRGFAPVGTGFERDIGGGATRRLSGDFQRLAFGMGPAADGRHRFGDDLSVLDEDAADRGIGQRLTLVAKRNLDGPRHESFVIGTARHVYAPPSVSRAILALISAITFSKSSAWLKSR